MAKKQKPDLKIVKPGQSVVQKPKKIYERKQHITLTRDQYGKIITDIKIYMEKDPYRSITSDDAAILLENICSARTIVRYRAEHKESGDEIGPQYDVYLKRIVRYKIIYIYNFLNGLPWIKQNSSSLSLPSDAISNKL